MTTVLSWCSEIVEHLVAMVSITNKSYNMSNLYNFSENFRCTHFVVFHVHDIGIYV